MSWEYSIKCFIVIKSKRITQAGAVQVTGSSDTCPVEAGIFDTAEMLQDFIGPLGFITEI